MRGSDDLHCMIDAHHVRRNDKQEQQSVIVHFDAISKPDELERQIALWTLSVPLSCFRLHSFHRATSTGRWRR